MSDYSGDEYRSLREWVVQLKRDGHTWDEIAHFCVESDKERDVFDDLQINKLLIPDSMSFEEWPDYVNYVKSRYALIIEHRGVDNEPSNMLPVQMSVESSWGKYKDYLSGRYTGKARMSSDSIELLEYNCHWILNHLERETRASAPKKGLVMGGVQSGKTANMIGLITMAAEHDWNIFIVLSGTIENLRRQTRDRIFRDLKKSGGKSWHIMDQTNNPLVMKDLDNDGSTLMTADALYLNTYQDGVSSNNWLHRYVFVCLKNARRLSNLINWLHSDSAMAARMRIVVIDDEADQASVNTVKMGTAQSEEDIARTTVNQLIIDLVKGCNSEGVPATTKFQAMNYVSFTATPYANVLNEAYRDSLYPSDFLCCLPEPKEYFGAKVIWGSKQDESYPGLDIVRDIVQSDMDEIKLLNQGRLSDPPISMRKSIAWFICAAAVLRKRGHKKPISMLIHTTALQVGHFKEYEVIRDWLNISVNNGKLMDLCESEYAEEKDKFRLEDLKECYPDYAVMAMVNDEFPDFSDIKPEIEIIISEITNIKLNEDNQMVFHSGIHLCVDNCSAKKWADEGTYLRIIYPSDEELAAMAKAPVFIVMGGNTLSRGLTLEGLVCTYFARNVNQADTLMQMARWFGYRHGYELLQRIWMNESVQQKFELIAEIDEKLREEFDDFMKKGKSPSEFGPKIMNSSKIAKFMLTAKNKSQNMITCDVDFTGDSYEVTSFENSDDGLKKNIEVTEAFLECLGHPVASEAIEGSYVWFNVDSQKVISEFLEKYQIFSCSTMDKSMPFFMKWINQVNSEGKLLKWNVAVAGDKKSDTRWQTDDFDVGKVERSRKRKKENYIDIGSLRSGRDVLSDVIVSKLSDEMKTEFANIKKSGSRLIPFRYDAGLGDNPLLLLYRIDKDKGNISKNRLKIESVHDIVSFSIVIAGEEISSDYIKSVTVRIPD